MSLLYATVNSNPIIITGNVGQTVTTSLAITSSNVFSPVFNTRDVFYFSISLDGGTTWTTPSATPHFNGAGINTPGAVSSFNYTFTYTINPVPLVGLLKIIYHYETVGGFVQESEQIIDLYTLSAFAFCLNRTSCHTWKITTPSGAPFVAELKNEYGILIGTYTASNNVIILEKDGIYTVDMLILTYRVSNTLIDFCDLFACVESMLNFIYCKSNAPLEVGDPCYTAKNPEDCNSKKIEKYRFELNKILAAYFALMLLLNKTEIEYLGLSCVQSNQQKDYAEIKKIYDTLSKLIKDCGGKCNGGSQYVINSNPCKTC